MRRLLKLSCDKHYARGCAHLGAVNIEDGDVQNGKALLKTACDYGETSACSLATSIETNDVNDAYATRAAFFLAQGNKAEAKKLFKLACDGGRAGSCVDLSVMEAEDGHLAASNSLMRTACSMGDKTACERLGLQGQPGTAEGKAH